MEEMSARMQTLLTPEGIGRGLAFSPRPSDVIISPYGKSGTTWTQQIVHGLRTRGDMDFDDISRVVPWLETSTDLGIDLDAEQKAAPRAFKSHLPYMAVPKGCRYIVPVRNPRDALVSLYRFFENWWFEPGSITVDEFARGRYFKRGEDSAEGSDYWTHFSSWWAVRDDPSVLLLAFENMKRDLPGTVKRIAAFLEIPLDDQLEEIVVRQASLDFMLGHKDRFDDKLVRERSEAVCGLPSGSDSAKVRLDDIGSRAPKLSREVLAEMDALWEETIGREHGLASYEEAVGLLA
jgi:hypothetical protein